MNPSGTRRAGKFQSLSSKKTHLAAGKGTAPRREERAVGDGKVMQRRSSATLGLHALLSCT